MESNTYFNDDVHHFDPWNGAKTLLKKTMKIVVKRGHAMKV